MNVYIIFFMFIHKGKGNLNIGTYIGSNLNVLMYENRLESQKKKLEILTYV